jgi:hypothetical protein
MSFRLAPLKLPGLTVRLLSGGHRMNCLEIHCIMAQHVTDENSWVVRVSTEKQADRGVSLEAQAEKFEQWLWFTVPS